MNNIYLIPGKRSRERIMRIFKSNWNPFPFHKFTTHFWNGRSLNYVSIGSLKIVRHVKIMSHSNPYDKEWESYFKERAMKQSAKYKSTSKVVKVIWQPDC